MSLVKNVLHLKKWQSDKDDHKLEGMIHESLSHHPGVELKPRPIKLQGLTNVSVCSECGDAEFSIRDSLSGKTEPWCRGCINTIRQGSLNHRQYTNEICISCETTTDSLGIITGAIHITMPYENETLSNGRTRLGLNPLIASGSVDLNHDIITVSVP